jgi:site-specific DNA-methyltransferase (adenine-specific)
MIRIYHGDALERLRGMADGSVNCIVTSPPYWGLRDYGHPDQLGLEPTPGEYVDKLVTIFREARRVLADDGTLWLNLGDSYNGRSANRTGQNGYNDGRANRDKRYSVGGVEYLKPKDLVGMPWRVAFALQADGWWLRQDIIWHKPNPMPESVPDRCTKAHEYVFLMSKSERYHYAYEDVVEPAEHAGDIVLLGVKSFSRGQASGAGVAPSGNGKLNQYEVGHTRNRRSVWKIATQPYRGAHFAVMPPALIEPCILAGCPKAGTVLDPFGGAGTVGLVADRLGRNAVLIELNDRYCWLARNRIQEDAPMFTRVEVDWLNDYAPDVAWPAA